ncbi:MAG TPA: leucine-rich repeat protein, partial [Syntrophomonas sp.]|nr:leucine-rich repeat protein [Syntrophomonas sp.]
IKLIAEEKLDIIDRDFACRKTNDGKWILVRYIGGETQVTLPEEITAIEAWAFAGCAFLEKIVFPPGLTSIGKSAFQGCISLRCFRIPGSVREICQNAFSRCTGLQEIEFNEGLQIIDSFAFEYCRSLAQVALPASVMKIDAGAFFECSSLLQIDYNNPSAQISRSAFGNTPFMKTQDLIYIGPTFYACQNELRREAEIASGTVSIADHAFDHAGNLNTLIIPSTVYEIGAQAFSDCHNLETLDIRSDQLRLAPDAFLPALTEDEVLASYKIMPNLRAAYIPGMQLHDGRFSRLMRIFLTFCYLTTADRHPTAEARMYVKYIGNHRDDIMDEIIARGSLAALISAFQQGLFNIRNIDKALEKANSSGNSEFVAALLNFKNESFTDQQMDREADRQLEAELQWDPCPIDRNRRRWSVRSLPDGSVEITAYKGNYFDLLIPSAIHTRQVDSIGEVFFADRPRRREDQRIVCKALRTVAIEAGIRVIGNHAFDGCSSLEKIQIPDSVTEIGDYAFRNCVALQAIILPSGLRKIGRQAFSGCAALREITLPDRVEWIGPRVFEDCPALADITLPQTAIWESGDGVFRNCAALKNLEFPDNFPQIGAGIFENCYSLEAIRIPKAVEEIGPRSFAGCHSLHEVILPPGLKKIGTEAFQNCVALESLELPLFLTELGAGAFSHSGLKQMILPSDIISLPAKCFEGCARLQRAELPARLENIGATAFCNCFALENVALPPILKTIGAQAFSGCATFTDVIAPAGIVDIGQGAWADCAALQTFILPAENIRIFRDIFGGVTAPKNAYVPGVQLQSHYLTAENRIFYACGFLIAPEKYSETEQKMYLSFIHRRKPVILQRFLQTRSRDDLQKALAAGIVDIHNIDTAVRLAEARQDPEIISWLRNYRDTHFTQAALQQEADRKQRKALALRSYPNGCDKKSWQVRKLDDGSLTLIAYKGHGTEVTVPEKIGRTKVSRIEQVFYKYRDRITPPQQEVYAQLRTVAIQDGVLEIGAYAFAGCTLLESVSVPPSVGRIGLRAFRECRALREILIPAGLTKIEDECFFDCSSLRSVMLPDSVTHIGFAAFKCCSRLEMIRIPDSVTLIESGAFYLCEGLTLRCRPGSYAEAYAKKNGIRTELEQEEECS